MNSKKAKSLRSPTRSPRQSPPVTAATPIRQLDALLADGDLAEFFTSLGDHARSTHGIARLAQKTLLNRTALYDALSRTGNPRLRTVAAVLDELGLRLSIQRRR